MADQQFCLRWNNHQNTLVSVFDSLLASEILVDCTLAAEGQFLRAHKVVLSACSPFFSDLLRQHYEKHPILIMKDVKFSQLKAMLDYMYRGEVNIAQDQLTTFLEAAESLQIKGLSDSAPSSDSSSRQKPSTHGNKVSRSSRPPEENRPASRPGSVSPHRKKKRKLQSESGDENVMINEESGSDSVLDAVIPSVSKSVVSCQSASTLSLPLRDEVNTPSDQCISNRVPQSSGTISFKNDILLHQPSENQLTIQPKSEIVEVDSVEDLTLDDDNLHSAQSLSENDAGYSWHMDRTSEDAYLSAQESSSGHRNVQDTWFPTLQTHQEVAPLQYGPYSCPRCGRKYAVLYTLERHLRYECGVDKQFACPVCQRRFSRRDVLRTHQKNAGHFTETETAAKTFMDMIALSTNQRKP